MSDNSQPVERWVAMQLATLMATDDESPPVDDMLKRHEIYSAYLRVAARMARITFAALEMVNVDIESVDWHAYQQALAEIERQMIRDKQAAFELAHGGE